MRARGLEAFGRDLCAYRGQDVLQCMAAMQRTVSANIRSIDELLERDKQREEDGFPRKIDVGRLIKPGKSGKQKVVIVPTTVEEKFLHDISFRTEEEKSTGGSGDWEEGEVIGEQPVRAPDGAGRNGPGAGRGRPARSRIQRVRPRPHPDSEKFQLPNLKDKGKKRSLTRYTYDLTDHNRGFGQVLDKKATLRKIVETNIDLGNLPDVGDIESDALSGCAARQGLPDPFP